MILAKTLKLVIFLKENYDFQEIEHQKNEKNFEQIDEKLHVFWDLDFVRILGGFWEGFGRPKWSKYRDFWYFLDVLFETLILIEFCLIFN